MFRIDRAKQFAPFDALKGLSEELRKREEKFLLEEKHELLEEEKEELTKILIRVKKGIEVEITFYLKGRYVTIEGKVTEFSTIYKYIRVGEVKIFFDDIKKIKV